MALLARFFVAAALGTPLEETAALDPLPPVHSVSGFSAGGSMAIIHLIAFSSVVEGAGIVGGSPYGCNILPDAENTCSGWQHNSSEPNTTIPWTSFLDTCRAYLQARATAGTI